MTATRRATVMIASDRVPTVARELHLSGRKYWIVSEPYRDGWKAVVHEVLDEGMARTEPVGIEASAETRGAADEAAERKLRRLLGVRQ